jgi:hypothetical protein
MEKVFIKTLLFLLVAQSFSTGIQSSMIKKKFDEDKISDSYESFNLISDFVCLLSLFFNVKFSSIIAHIGRNNFIKYSGIALVIFTQLVSAMLLLIAISLSGDLFVLLAYVQQLFTMLSISALFTMTLSSVCLSFPSYSGIFFAVIISSITYPETFGKAIGNALVSEGAGLITLYFLSLLPVAGLVGYLYTNLPTLEENIEEAAPANWNDLFSVKVKDI